MTRDAQIEDALRLLAPLPECQDECRRVVAEAFHNMDEEVAAGGVGNKQHKIALRSLLSALRQVEAAGRHLQRFDKGWSEPESLKPQIASCERELKRSRHKSLRRIAKDKYQAVYFAEKLLRAYGHRASKTRHGLWMQLAAILYGRPQADLFNIIERFRPFISPRRLRMAQR